VEVIEIKMKFKKPCKRCGKIFRPKTPHSYICEDCKKPIGWEAHKLKLKEEE